MHFFNNAFFSNKHDNFSTDSTHTHFLFSKSNSKCWLVGLEKKPNKRYGPSLFTRRVSSYIYFSGSSESALLLFVSGFSLG